MLQVPTLLTDAHQLMDALHEKSARYMSSLYCSAQLLHRYGDLGGVSSCREGTYETLFTQPEKFPEVIKEKKVVRDLLIQSLV